MSIIIGSALMIIGATLQAASQNCNLHSLYYPNGTKKFIPHAVAMFIISRLILGLGIPFAIVAASSLIGELSHPKERARLGSLFNSSYGVGSILTAGVTMGTFNMSSNWGWRIPSLLQLTPSLLQVAFISLLPESPRWLISKGRGAEAMAILVKYHAEGDINSQFVKAEYAQIERTLEIELETRKTSWKDFVSTAGMHKRLLIVAFLGLFTQWSGNGLTG
jgi:MFS family permease